MNHLPYSRAERVADAIREVVAEAVQTRLADPRIKGAHITRVNVTADLRTARVCFHILEADEARRKEVLKGLNSSRGYLKRLIGDAIELKFMPELVFYYDEGVDTGERIEELLKAVNREP